MNLREYIKLIGAPAAASLFGVKERTVESWLYEGRYPSRKKAALIVEVTGGKVDWAGIFAPKSEGAA